MHDLSFDIHHSKALLIGIGDYEFLPKIEPAVNNIQDMAALLLNPAILGLEEKNIIKKLNIRNDEILDLVNDFLSDVNNIDTDALFLYYVGHGHREKNSRELYLTGINSKTTTIKVSGIPYNEVKQLIEQSQIQKRIVILDACHSGLAAMDSDLPYTENELDIKGSYLLASSAGNEKSFFDSNERNTFFTKEFFNLIKNGLPQPSPLISLDDIFNYLHTHLKQSAPQRKTNLNVRDFYMFRNPAFDLYSFNLNAGDKLFEDGFYEEAKSKFLEANFHKSTDEIRQRIDKCDEYILIAQKIKPKVENQEIKTEKRKEKKQESGFFYSKKRWFLTAFIVVIFIISIILIRAYQNKKMTTNHDNQMWKEALKADTYERYERYLQLFPNGIYRQDADRKIDSINRITQQNTVTVDEQSAWDKALKINTISAFKNYLSLFPKGNHTVEAVKRINDLSIVWADNNFGQYTDIRDNKGYDFIRIGDYVVMTENFAFRPESGKYWIHPDKSKYKNYGIYYDWETARKIVPPGWHLPSEKEWSVVMRLSYKKLVESQDGLKLKLGGYCDDTGNFPIQGGIGYYWTSTRVNKAEFKCIKVISDRLDCVISSHPCLFGANVRLFKDP